MPAPRSSSASSSVQTPSQVAPASRAARATGTAPCPYPSAFTTAITAAPGRGGGEHPTLCRTAARSTTRLDRGPRGNPPRNGDRPCVHLSIRSVAHPRTASRVPGRRSRRVRLASPARSGRCADRPDRRGIACWIADDGTGAPSAAISAARACRNAPQPAAHHGSSPAARSAPTIPVSTSPDPAVAAHDVVDGCTSVRPSGSATTVALPLSSTVTRSAAAARRAAAIRSGPTSPGDPGELPVVRGDHHGPAGDRGRAGRRARPAG